MAAQPQAAHTAQPPTVELADLHRLTSEEYHRLIEAGAFEDWPRVELIEGLLCDMSARGRWHELVVEHLIWRLSKSLDDERYRLRAVAALSLGRSEPEPDFAIVRRGSADPYHPGSAALVIEVAASSHRRDLLVKPRIYAQAGVEEYWVVDVKNGLVIVHREPSADGYGSRVELGRDGVLDGSVVEIGELPIAEILAVCEGPR
jgi:Uma2 family endonuclease